MIRIKDYIFPEENILYIRQRTKDSVTVLRKKPNEYDNFKTELEIEATFDDIEWNYGTPQETQRQMQKELCKSCYYRDTISNELKELEEKIKTFEDYNKDLNNQLDKLEERINKALDKLYCYGEVFDSTILQQFQKEMKSILKGEENESN